MPLAPNIHVYPPGVTYRDLIAQNKRSTALLVFIMGCVTIATVMGAIFLMIAFAGVRPSNGAIALSLIVSLGITAAVTCWSYYGGAATLLSMSGAQPIEKPQDPQLFNVVEELSIAAGVPMPAVYLIESEALNAFATGRDPQHAAVAITTGLRQRLTRDELQGVLAHEMAHVRHYDIRLTMMLATMAGLIVLASDMAWQVVRFGGSGRRSSSSDSDSKGGGVLIIVAIVVALILAVVAPIIAQLLQLAVSRQREYMADAGAVELTRNPQGLIDALLKLQADEHELAGASKATSHLYIVNPILHAAGDTEVDSAFATHPPMSKRIERLYAMLH